MTNHYFDATVPVFTRSLKGLKQVLKKGKEYANEKHVSDEVFLKSRLAVDMFDLTKQVQVACDNAKGSAARLAGVEVPKMEDNETTFAELEARIDKTLAFLHTLTPEHFADAGKRTIVLPYFKGKHFIGHEYLESYAIPNFFFHVVTAYDILRHLGVNIGKSDYINELPLHDD